MNDLFTNNPNDEEVSTIRATHRSFGGDLVNSRIVVKKPTIKAKRFVREVRHEIFECMKCGKKWTENKDLLSYEWTSEPYFMLHHCEDGCLGIGKLLAYGPKIKKE